MPGLLLGLRDTDINNHPEDKVIHLFMWKKAEPVTFELEECHRKEGRGQREDHDQMLGGMKFMGSGSDSWITGSQKESDRW